MSLQSIITASLTHMLTLSIARVGQGRDHRARDIKTVNRLIAPQSLWHEGCLDQGDHATDERDAR